MLRYVQGNLLESKAEALVNTVNTVGVMGKGIALQFKEQFPLNFRVYEKAAKKGNIKPGELLIVKEINLERDYIIINFPTKTDWYKKSSYQYIEGGLKTLAQEIRLRGIKSIAIPPLGCGNGGLSWSKVRPMIEQYLGNIDIDIEVFEPSMEVKALLQKRETPTATTLTPARSLLLYSLYAYEAMGESPSLFTANKLAYFLQRMGENLRLTFKPYKYGPYSVQVENVLYALNGKYLKGLEQKQAFAFEELKLQYDTLDELREYLNTKISAVQKMRLENLILFINGYQSGLALEVLASVDFILNNNPGFTEEQVFSSIQAWSDRKKKLITKKHIDVAYRHLKDYANQLYIS